LLLLQLPMVLWQVQVAQEVPPPGQVR